MPRRDLVLASGSPARYRLLTAAGFAPRVVPSGVGEEGVDGEGTRARVLRLARAKAEAVADLEGDAIVIGCDSLLDFEGRTLGKPESSAEARRWLAAMRGGCGTLFTGHCLIDESTGTSVEDVAGTLVRFGDTSDQELDAYLATGEAMEVAGAFTLDGRSAPFVDGVDGDPGNVIGLSLPLFRSLLSRMGIAVTDLWDTT
jgi:septum formation protein